MLYSGLLGRPQAEAVVMLRDEDDIFRPGIANGAHPLVGIELSGIEDARVGRAVAPLSIEKSVGGEVKDDAEFEILPGDLVGRGPDHFAGLSGGLRYATDSNGDSGYG
jgi:hypothetical protein